MISREGWYMVKKITSGQVVERRKSYVGRKPSRRGARIKGNSGEKKQENNRQQAVLALARVLNCNYTHGDALLTLTFVDEALARCGGTFEGAVKEAKNFLGRMARRMKKHGDILKWVLVPSEVDGETGEAVRLHCHIVINSAGLGMEDRTFTLYGEPLDDIWGRGTVDVQLLRDQKDYYPLALYLIRQARNIPDGKKYTSSRNMEKPKVEYTYVLTPAQLRVPAGATTLPGTRYEPELGVNFVRYIPREKDPARKIGGRKEIAVACAGEEGEDDGL